jgi:predicted PurR-regulated permease PerM
MARPLDEEFRLFRYKLWLVFATLAAAALAFFLRDLLLLTFLSLLIAVFWDQLATGLQARLGPRLPRWGAVTLAVVITLAAVSLFVFFLSRPLSEQLNAFIAEWPRIRQDAWMRLQPLLRRFGLGDVTPRELGTGGVTAGLVPLGVMLVGTGLHAAAAVLAVFFLAYFWALQPARYRAGLLALLSPAAAAWLGLFLTAVHASLRNWLKATGFAMLAVSAMTTLLLVLAGVPYALLFGAAAGVFDLIPFLGPALAFAGPALVTVTLAPEKTFWLVAGYLIVQTIEGHVIQPYFMAREAELPPALTVFTVFAMSTLFGVLGLFLAAPTLIIVLALSRARRASLAAPTPG